MTPQANRVDEDIRTKILNNPNAILDDGELMRALSNANDAASGGNVVDLRGIAMERLEERLDRLEDTHRSIIAAAYDNLAGTNMIQRAVLCLLDPIDFPDFLAALPGPVAQALRVDTLRLMLETPDPAEEPALKQFEAVLTVAPRGSVDAYMTRGRPSHERKVMLRQVSEEDETLHRNASWIRSEACLRLDFGPGRLPGMLVLGSEDPHQFAPSQGTDLLQFFAEAFERAMRRWLG